MGSQNAARIALLVRVHRRTGAKLHFRIFYRSAGEGYKFFFEVVPTLKIDFSTFLRLRIAKFCSFVLESTPCIYSVSYTHLTLPTIYSV